MAQGGSIKKVSRNHPSQKSKNKKKGMGPGKAQTKRKAAPEKRKLKTTYQKCSKVFFFVFCFLFFVFCFLFFVFCFLLFVFCFLFFVFCFLFFVFCFLFFVFCFLFYCSFLFLSFPFLSFPFLSFPFLSSHQKENFSLSFFLPFFSPLSLQDFEREHMSALHLTVQSKAESSNMNLKVLKTAHQPHPKAKGKKGKKD